MAADYPRDAGAKRPPDDRRPEAVLFCGIQASGKTSLYCKRFVDTHVRVSRDLLRTPHRETVFLRACLDTRQSFVVDKTNATPEHRAPYIAAARAAGFRVVAYWLPATPRSAIARNAQRPERWRVPVPAILGTYKRIVPPRLEEGFDAVRVVEDEPRDDAEDPVR
jgi:hypothetical protein